MADQDGRLRELESRVEALVAEKDRLSALVLSLSERTHGLAELLSKRAERAATAARVAELEAALAPFAKLLLLEWDRSGAPADALYPVRLGDLRAAARALAGTAAPRVG